MFLNETKPPLEEALVHFGVKGMRWGHRRSDRALGREVRRNNASADDYYTEEEHSSDKKKIALGILVGVGAAATVVALHKTGHLKLATEGYKNLSGDSPSGVGEKARATAKEAFGTLKKTTEKQPPIDWKGAWPSQSPNNGSNWPTSAWPKPNNGSNWPANFGRPKDAQLASHMLKGKEAIDAMPTTLLSSFVPQSAVTNVVRVAYNKPSMPLDKESWVRGNTPRVAKSLGLATVNGLYERGSDTRKRRS